MGGPEFRTTCDMLLPYYLIFYLSPKWCHEKTPYIFEMGGKMLPTRKFLDSWCWKKDIWIYSPTQGAIVANEGLVFLGCPGGGDYSWEGRTTQEMLSEPITFLTAFHLTKRSLALSFFITFWWWSCKIVFWSCKIVFYFWSLDMSLLHHTYETSSWLSANSYFFSQIMIHLWIAKNRITGSQWSDFNSPRNGGDAFQVPVIGGWGKQTSDNWWDFYDHPNWGSD